MRKRAALARGPRKGSVMQKSHTPRPRCMQHKLAPIQARAREVWQNSVAPHFEVVMLAYRDSPAAAMRALQANFEHEFARAADDLLHDLIVETFDRPRAGACHDD